MPRRCFLRANGLGFLFQRKPWAKVGQLGLEEWWRKAEFLRVWRASKLWITPALKILKISFAQLPFRQQWVFEINVVWDPMWIMITIQGTNIYKRCKKLCTLASKHQITFIVTSPQHKCLGEWNSYERAPDSEKKQFTYGQTVQKKLHWSIYSAPDSAKKQQQQFTCGQTVQKNNKQFTYGQTVQKKLHWSIYSAPDSAKKTTTIYIWTVHIYRLYRRQCAKYTYIYSVHTVYYKDTLNYQRHIIHRMGTSTLCTVSIHNVVYT